MAIVDNSYLVVVGRVGFGRPLRVNSLVAADWLDGTQYWLDGALGADFDQARVSAFHSRNAL